MTTSAQHFIKDIQHALQEGNSQNAQALALQAAEFYPEDRELKKLAYLLAPPIIILGNPSPENRKMYRNWLQENYAKHRGRWIALSQGKLLAEADTSEDLKKQVSDSKDIVMVSLS